MNSSADPRPSITVSSAVLSPDERYRYRLDRQWGKRNISGNVVFIGLNPSTADHTVDDPTIRRCIGFAHRWGYRQLTMLNLFAYRATNPGELTRLSDPVGPDFEQYFKEGCAGARDIVACWGGYLLAPARAKQVIRTLLVRRRISCFAKLGFGPLYLTNSGQPRHPLYLPNDAILGTYIWGRR